MKDSEACRISSAQFLSNYKSPESERFVPFDVGGVVAGSPSRTTILRPVTVRHSRMRLSGIPTIADYAREIWRVKPVL
jgi:hypothetical protein